MTNTDDTLRAWVGCLACYNAGTLRGEWVDATDAGTFVPCTIPGHDEWWCMDLDNFPHDFGECSPATAQEFAENVEKVTRETHAPRGAVYAYLDYIGTGDLDGFSDAYQGEYESETAYAQEFAESIGAIQTDYAWPASYIDWDRAARDLFASDMWSAPAPWGCVYVFFTR